MQYLGIFAFFAYLLLSVLYGIGKLTPTRSTVVILTLALAAVSFIATVGIITE